ESTIGYAVLIALQQMRAKLAPPGTTRGRILDATHAGLRAVRRDGPGRVVRALGRRAMSQISGNRASRETEPAQTRRIEPVPIVPVVPPRTAHVDVIVCVHNAIEDVRRCLESVVRHTGAPFRLMVVDDGSGPETRDYLAEFCRAHGATLLRNET